MKSENGCGIGAEFPHAHKIDLINIVVFGIAWLVDIGIFRMHIRYGFFILDSIRVIIFLILLTLGFSLIKVSWKVITPEIYESETLLLEGIYKYIRHPMYMGILVIYMSLVLLNLSLIMLAAWILIFLVMNIMASYEERHLIKIFGQDYKNYKDKVSKWFPIKHISRNGI